MGGVALKVSQTITVKVAGREYAISRGTRVKPFLRRYFPDIEAECLGAIVANRLVDLEEPIAAPCELVPVTYASKEGARIYRATVTLMLCEAVARRFPGVRIQVGQALGAGYYFDVFKDPPLTPEDVATLEQDMRDMVSRKEAIATFRVPVPEAVEILSSSSSSPSKADIVKAMHNQWVPLVTMGQHVDLWMHPLLPTAEGARVFRLHPYADGLVLTFPPPGQAAEPPEALGNHRKLFATYRETRGWNRLLGVETVADLNRAIVTGAIGEVIRVAEALHERKIAAIADLIVKKECRLVLLAGPSSSGKTTTAKRLRLQLLAIGVRPRELSVDNYYVDRKKTPLDENGEPDFECIEAIDLDLLNDHLSRLMAGERVETPRFSFTRGERDTRTIPMQIGDKEILVIEGIHGLNDRLTPAVPADKKTRIYVSALTQLCIDDHNRIFTSDARLLRRIVRDRLFRGYSAAETLRMWPKVRRGEERHIFPFQDQADVMFNSTLVYETAVLKGFAERFLMEVPPSDPTFVEVVRLMEFLDLFVPVFTEDVPATSILREFIGKSAFDY